MNTTDRYPDDYGYDTEWTPLATVLAWIGVLIVVLGPALLLAWWLR